MNVFHAYTINSLKKNKTRTLVTIIGIILSVAMFTATTEAFVTAQNYLVNYAQTSSGKYHVGFYDVKTEDISLITDSDKVENYTYIQEIGYAEIGSSNEYKPYLYIGGIPDSFTDVMPIHLTAGRLPESINEIVVSDHLYSNGGVNLELGQQITLKVGARQWGELADISREEYEKLDGNSWGKLTQHTPLRKAEGEEATEVLINTKEKTYTVVGFCERPDQYSIEPYSAPGYTAFTINEQGNNGLQSIYTVLEKPGEYDKFSNDIMKMLNVESTINADLLMFTFHRNDSAFSLLAIGLLTILVALIVFGSVSLIYNSFSISVGERTKQFGILKSIGATKKQIKKSVLYEAAILCVVGIPIGLISGCIGIAVTFYALSSTISTFLADLTDLKMEFVLSPVALIASSALSFITVLISAYIPAKKAITINPIEAVRQSNEIKIKRRSVKVSPLTKKLFGFEATISSKNFKRNKRKYRTTVFSLFVSVVLFISASSLATYFTDIVETESQDMNYDINLDVQKYREDDYNAYYADEELKNKLLDEIRDIEDVDAFALVDSTHDHYQIDKNLVSRQYTDMINEWSSPVDTETQISGSFCFHFVDDNAFRRLLKEEGLNENEYFDKNAPKAVVYDMSFYSYQTNDKESVYSIPFLNHDKISGTISLTEIKTVISYNGEELWYSGTEEKDGTLYYVYDIAYDEGDVIDPSTKVYISQEEAVKNYIINIGHILKEKPFYIESGGVNLIYPKSVADNTLFEDFSYYTDFYIITDEHEKVSSSLTTLIRDMGESNSINVYDYAAEIESIRALVTVAKVLAYGFIVLISMIAAANVFNTISTNISLRRREIATLKSVGLTSKGLRKMMLFESLLYGMKSLAFSLPASFAITYLIYYVVSDSGYEMSFYVPWGNFAVAIVSVFIIVAISMVYSIKKINKENTVETLRNENI